MARRLATLLILPALLAFLSTSLALRADKTPAEDIKRIAAFTLTDPRDQSRVSLADFKEKKAVVVIFTGTECPINNAYIPRLLELHKQYAAKGMQFLAINSNRQDTPDQVALYAKKNAIPFPVLKDQGNIVADQFGARRTPEVFLLGAGGLIVYHGRIDDQFGIGYQKSQATQRDLSAALDEILAGKAVSRPSTPVSGCLISRAPKPKPEGTVTYSKHVARILQKNCQDCHRPGAIGPMSLLAYDDALSWGEMIREVVADNRMPPWYADPRHGKFANDRSLSKDDRETLLAWVAQNCPKGDDKDLPPPRRFSEGWTIGKPDLVIRMAEEHDVPAASPKDGIPYQYFTIDPAFKEDRWVTAGEAKAGALSVVHHIVVFVVPPGLKFVPELGNAPVLCGTAPGDMPLQLPEGMAKKVPAGSKFVLQLHYTPNGIAQKDRSSIGIIFARKPPERRVLTMPIANIGFRIPPGADNHEVQSSFTFRQDGSILGFMPHMHLRGKDFLYEAIYPDGTKEILLSVPRWNFGWQSVYRLAEPKRMPKGSKVHCVAHFDNSAKNLSNPDPTKEVHWGDQTWEEMMIGWIDFVYDRKAD